ncbi:MAG: RNA-binding protein [Phycisphaerales bacterium]|nr:RNA-binding protein [Phycisphaerales bacterium]
MAMFKIFVGNLSFNTTADSLKKLFSRHADVDDIAMAVDPETGKLRGFAIVMIRDENQGRAAIAALRNSRLDGRTLLINEARKKGDPPPPKRENRRGSGHSGGSGGGGFRGRSGSRPTSRGSAGGSSGYGGGGGGGGGGFSSRQPSRSRGFSRPNHSSGGQTGGGQGGFGTPPRTFGNRPSPGPNPGRPAAPDVDPDDE